MAVGNKTDDVLADIDGNLATAYITQFDQFFKRVGSVKKQAARRPFPMQLHQEAKSTYSAKAP